MTSVTLLVENLSRQIESYRALTKANSQAIELCNRLIEEWNIVKSAARTFTTFKNSSINKHRCSIGLISDPDIMILGSLGLMT
eukprot:scaffold151842_cov30-Tisochrysis_lutea.AAC.3